jgi:hypothetical protein
MNDETCEDCPPCGWPTDATRCADCPRRPDYYPACGGCKQCHKPGDFCPPEKPYGLLKDLRDFHEFLLERDTSYCNAVAAHAPFGTVLLRAIDALERK